MADHTGRHEAQVIRPGRRMVTAVVAGTFVVLVAIGAAFSATPIAGGASAPRQTEAVSPSARVPIDAALVTRARVAAEQKVVAELVRRQQQQLAAFYAAVTEFYRPKTGVNWDGIAQCETAGNWSMQGANYSGGLGFYNGTWSSFGGGQFAVNAGQATREQQVVVAERVYAAYGLSGWGCRAYG